MTFDPSDKRPKDFFDKIINRWKQLILAALITGGGMEAILKDERITYDKDGKRVDSQGQSR